MASEKLVSQVSAVTPLGQAIDGTAKKHRRAPKKTNPNSVVGTSWQCPCGQRFDDLAKASAHFRAEYAEARRTLDEMRHPGGRRLIALCGTESGYRHHYRNGEKACDPCKAANAAAERRRRADPAYAKRRDHKTIDYRRERRRRDPEYREQLNTKARERWRDDPEYRNRQNEKRRAARTRRKAMSNQT